jgi:hypothetical protein
MPYAEQSRDWGKAPAAAARDVLHVKATNVSHVSIDPQRARVSCAAQLDVDSDGPLSVDMPACDRSATVVAGHTVANAPRACQAAAGFSRAAVRPRGRGLRFDVTPAAGRRFDVAVFRESAGRRVLAERRVARFANRRAAFTWSGRGAGDGFYVVRYTARLAGRRTDVRRLALQRVHGRFRARPDYYRHAGCGELVSFKLTRPVFGGRGRRALGISYRLARNAVVSLTVLRGRRVVKRGRTATRRAGVTHRLRLASAGLRRGDYRVRLTIARPGARPVTATLTSRRL